MEGLGVFQEHSEGSENTQLGEDREHVGSVLKPRWTLQPAPISSQRWYNWQGRTEQGRHLWSSTVSSFPHCTYSFPLYVHRLHSPPSLFHYPPVTAGQFVHPAWLPPPLLLRYLARLLHFNGRYWLENFHDLFAIPCLKPLPFPATFNLITGFLKLFRGGRSQEDNSRTSGFTNTLLVLVWFWRGAAGPRPDRTVMMNCHSVHPSAALHLQTKGAQTAKITVSCWKLVFSFLRFIVSICTFWFLVISEIKASNIKPVVSS